MSDGREEREEQEQRRKWREKEDPADGIDHPYPYRDEDHNRGREPS